MVQDTVCHSELHATVAGLEAELGGLRDLMEAKYEGIRDRMDERLARFDERDAASKEAQAIAAMALDEFKKSSNEWRGALGDTLARTITRQEYEREHRSVLDRVEELRLGSSERRGKDEVLAAQRVTSRWLIGISVATIVEAAAIFIHLLGK